MRRRAGNLQSRAAITPDCRPITTTISKAMPPPDPHAIAVMALTVVALYLFSRESIAIETSSLLIVALLAIGFSVFPYDAEGAAFEPIKFFSGFGNEALIAICALMMASQGLVATGALTPIGRVVSRIWIMSPMLAMGVVLVVTAIASAFMNNTPQVVLMIPILTSVALRSGTSPSKLLMPMTFSAQIGGMGTPIGTSLNLLVIGSAASLGVERFHMFDFLAPAALAAIPGLAYLWLIAPRLLARCAIAFHRQVAAHLRGATPSGRRQRRERRHVGAGEEADRRGNDGAFGAAPAQSVDCAASRRASARRRSTRRPRHFGTFDGVCSCARREAVLGRRRGRRRSSADCEGSADGGARADACLAAARSHARAGEFRLALPIDSACNPSSRRARCAGREDPLARCRARRRGRAACAGSGGADRCAQAPQRSDGARRHHHECAADLQSAARARDHARDRRGRIASHRAGRHCGDLRRVADGGHRLPEMARRHACARFLDDSADRRKSGAESRARDDRRRGVHRAGCWSRSAAAFLRARC